MVSWWCYERFRVQLAGGGPRQHHVTRDVMGVKGREEEGKKERKEKIEETSPIGDYEARNTLCYANKVYLWTLEGLEAARANWPRGWDRELEARAGSADLPEISLSLKSLVRFPPPPLPIPSRPPPARSPGICLIQPRSYAKGSPSAISGSP